MQKSESIAKLAPALVKAQSEIKAAQKSGDNKFDRYKYSKLEDFFDQAKPILAKHGLAMVIGNPVVAALLDRSTKAGGSEHACQVMVEVTLIHESGEWIEVVGYGEGQDRADKSIYKAITGAKKYAVAGLLAIPTTDDPEADETVGNAPAPAVKTTSKGEVYTKQPKWTPEQLSEAGTIRADIMAYGGDPADREVAKLKGDMKGDEPSHVIDALIALRAKWDDIKNQATQEG